MGILEYKIVVLGCGSVGKSAVTVQFVNGVFLEKYDPTIEDNYRKQIEVDDNHVILEIMDTAGTEQFTAMRDLYMRSGEGFVVVYAINSRATFNCITDIKDQILRVKEVDEVPMMFVGNKCDLESERVITTEEGEKLAKEHGCGFLETSAKTKANIDKVFYDLVRMINKKNGVVGGEKKKRSGCVIL